jgi:chloramphenicol O-acetyltransferase
MMMRIHVWKKKKTSVQHFPSSTRSSSSLGFYTVPVPTSPSLQQQRRRHPTTPPHTHTRAHKQTKHYNFPFATKQTLASVDTYLVDHLLTSVGWVFQFVWN